MNSINGSGAPDEMSPANANSDNTSSGHHLRRSNGYNDCGAQLSNGASSNSSLSYGGARPKTRKFEENIPNGSLNQLPLSCSKNDSQSIKCNQNELSSLRVNEHQCQSNGSNNDIQPFFQQACDNGAQAGPSRPHPMYNDNGETDASRLAAVCAASSLRAMAERARQAERKVNRLCSPAHSDSSSDTGNDDCLSGDECCIYTYKGDQNADLSNGLLGLSLPQANDHPMPLHPAEEFNRDGASSPEMDFLEMDFDPDPLGEQDSIDEDNLPENPVERSENAPTSSPSVEEAPNEVGTAPLSPEQSSSEEEEEVEVAESTASSDAESTDTDPEAYQAVNMGASTSTDSPKDLNFIRPKFPTFGNPKEILRGQHIAGSQLCPVDADDAQKLSLLTARAIKSANSENEPMLEKQKFNLYSALYHSIMANNLILDEEEQEGARGGTMNNCSEDHPQKIQHELGRNELTELEKTMIWTEREACHKQVSQIAVSACGAAAVSNVLSALNIPFTLESVHDGVATRLRAEKASLPTYLFSRSAAGAAHNDLIRGLDIASDGAVYSRFFHMYPEREFCLSKWLAHWIKEGAVPIATLNIQRSAAQGATIPDSWHHQMIFGVSHRGIYLTNPLECVREEILHPQLSSPSVLLIRRQDIVSRWTASTDLCRLATSSDIRWKQMNVLGQVVNIIREANARPPHYLFRRNFTSHISIPASYCSGILLCAPKDSPAAVHLKDASELPFKNF